ncbi:MAG: type IX secretion system membrane protein PorP/SprF [Bacteroidota bacterium]|nr:type IX secretion system membrane protein PorP/SprF [Bacteroidota bacterium]
MRYIYSILFIIILSFTVKAQRYSAIYSQYMLNGLAINPAYAGSRDCFSNVLLYRHQWMGFDGAPVTQVLSSHASLKNEKHAVGLTVLHEEIGELKNFDFYSNYAFRFRLGSGLFSLGLKAGVTIDQNNLNDISTGNGVDDPAFPNTVEKFVKPNFGVGVYYYNKKFFLGASVPYLLSYGNEKFEMYHNINNYDFLFTSGVLLSLAENFKLKPSVLGRYRLTGDYSVDASLSFIFFDALWLGGSYRFENEYSFRVQYQLNNQIRIGYAYDYPTGDIKDYNINGSHEIILRYDFKYKIKAVNPRYF